MPGDNPDPESDDDASMDVEYGVRRSRRRTTFERRSSSSLYPIEFMDMAVYNASAERYFSVALLLIQVVILLVALQDRMSMIAAYWEQLSTVASNITASLRRDVKRIKAQVDRLLFVINWILACGEMCLLYAEDLAVFCRPRERRFKPEINRSIDDLTPEDCDFWFRLSPDSLRRLFIYWRVPRSFRTHDRRKFSGETCFLIFLYHLRKGMPFTSMARHVFGGDPRRYTPMFRLMVNHLYFTFYNKISGTSLEQWLPRYLDRCRLLVYNALHDTAILRTEHVGEELVGAEWIYHTFDFASFRIFGFMDDFAIPAARPSDIFRRLGILIDTQRAFYSGYLRAHGLKAQIVYLPIGIIGSVFITEIRQNDNGVQNISGLNNYLVDLLAGCLLGALLPALYCDGIFACLACILPRFVNPTALQRLLNLRLASLRQIMEHLNADHRTNFRLFEIPRSLSVVRRGPEVRRLCLVSYFVLNCYYCEQGTRCTYFGQVSPTLEDYIPLWEDIPPPPAVDLGPIWDV